MSVVKQRYKENTHKCVGRVTVLATLSAEKDKREKNDNTDTVKNDENTVQEEIHTF